MAPTATRSRSHYIGLALIVASVLSVSIALWKFQDIHDFIRLYGYQAPARVSAIADTTTMTNGGRKLFYVNRPQVLDAKGFATKCPAGAEKTVVLGCYKSNDTGIYLFDVADARLNGVVEVTAAHEMLHAAYMRLTDTERAKLDAQLTDYYENTLQDKRIKDTIDAYKQTEPTELVNEMHSIFGTEVAELPPGLETHYAKYFVNRRAVVELMQKYQAEFVGRQEKIDGYDSQLKQLKARIDSGQAELEALGARVEREQSRLNSLRSAGQYSAYNAAVNPYNALVSAYNSQIYQTKADINQYNAIVEARNAVASEQQQLMKSLSSEPVTQTR